MLIVTLRTCRAKSYLLALRLRRSHHLADCVEYYFELPIVFLFQFIELVCEFSIGTKHLAQPNKSADDFEVHLNSALAFQDALQHCNALLG